MALNLPDTSTNKQNADGQNAPIVSQTTPNVSTRPYNCAKIVGSLDGSMPSDGMGGKK